MCLLNWKKKYWIFWCSLEVVFGKVFLHEMNTLALINVNNLVSHILFVNTKTYFIHLILIHLFGLGDTKLKYPIHEFSLLSHFVQKHHNLTLFGIDSHLIFITFWNVYVCPCCRIFKAILLLLVKLSCFQCLVACHQC